MAFFDPGVEVWVPREQDFVVPATVVEAFAPGQPGVVRLRNVEDVLSLSATETAGITGPVDSQVH